MSYWKNRSLLRLADHPAEAIGQLLYRARQLKRAKNAGAETPLLAGKNVALIFEKTSTRTRCSAEVACFDQGARCSYIAGSSSQLGHKESIADSARVLGRYYDAILWRGAAQRTVEILAAEAGVPVINGLSDDFHPLQLLADLLTMQEHSDKNLTDISFAYVGDARFNMGNSLLLAGALLGLDVRIAAPAALQPREEIVAEALRLAEASGGRIHIGTDPVAAVAGVDFIHTDIWLSMGEDPAAFGERCALLLPYRVDEALLAASGNPAVKFMHCLPSYHDRETALGAQFYADHGLEGIEVSAGVFSSPASIVFDQAENRLHTLKALLVAQLEP